MQQQDLYLESKNLLHPTASGL